MYVSTSRTPTDAERCGVQSGSVHIHCSYKIGRYLIIRQPDVTIEEMMFCEARVRDPCGFLWLLVASMMVVTDGEKHVY